MAEKTDAELEAERDEEDRKIMAAMECDALLYLRNAADMTEELKLAIADWLRLQATNLLADGHNYNFLFRARYNPEE